ncbi:MAG: orotidine 5'-phosphate decarboxylase / HUMPS family protein, partial [Pseudomonadota bacterium]
MEARDRLIVALDVESAAAAESLAGKLEGTVRYLKVGLELYTAAGPEVVRALARRGFGVMLDLKLHDIPETVA